MNGGETAQPAGRGTSALPWLLGALVLVTVVLGSPEGMMAANVPVVLAGRWLMERMPMTAARWGACLLFLGLGGLTLAGF